MLYLFVVGALAGAAALLLLAERPRTNRWILGADPEDTPQAACKRIAFSGIALGREGRTGASLPPEVGGELGRVRPATVVSIRGRRQRGGR